MSLGGYDLERYAQKDAKITWHDCDPDSQHWQLTLDSMTSIDNDDSSSKFGLIQGEN